MDRPEYITLTDEQVAVRKRRNKAIALSLVAFCVLVFVVTVTNLQRNSEAARVAAEKVRAAEAATEPAAPVAPFAPEA